MVKTMIIDNGGSIADDYVYDKYGYVEYTCNSCGMRHRNRLYYLQQKLKQNTICLQCSKKNGPKKKSVK